MLSSQKGFNFFPPLSPFLRIPIFSPSLVKRGLQHLCSDPFFSTSYLWESGLSDVECPLLGTCALRSCNAQWAPPAPDSTAQLRADTPLTHSGMPCAQPSSSCARCFGLCHFMSISAYFWNFSFESKSGGAHGHQQWQHRTALTWMLTMLLLFYASFWRSNDSPSAPRSQCFLLCLIYPHRHGCKSIETLTSVFNGAHRFRSYEMSECGLPYFTSVILPLNLITAKYQVLLESAFLFWCDVLSATEQEIMRQILICDAW